MTDEQKQISGEGEAVAEKSDNKKKATPRKTKKKTAKSIPQGCAFVQATYNNTLVTITDPHGNVLAWSSAGHMGFKGPKKSTPYAASMVVRDVATKAQGVGLREVHVFIQGVGSGREGAIRAFNAQGFTVLSIKDITPVPHNGCRPPRPRRV